MPTEREAIRAMLKDNPEVHDRLREMALTGKIKAFTNEDAASDELLTIVASDQHGGIIGSVQVKCDCGLGVWISPSTQAMIKARGANPSEIICHLCFHRTLMERREEKVKN
jgi:hypothetical protein